MAWILKILAPLAVKPAFKWLVKLLAQFVSSGALEEIAEYLGQRSDNATERHKADADMAAEMFKAEAKVRREEVQLALKRYEIGPTLWAILLILYPTALYWALYFLSRILHWEAIEPLPLTGAWAENYFWVVMALIGTGGFATLDWVRHRWKGR